MELKFTLEGKPVPGGRFGSTITSIGDVNKDGFPDIAVGAPGGERGAVYIFNGNSEGTLSFIHLFVRSFVRSFVSSFIISKISAKMTNLTPNFHRL